jgi:predicted small lipoprotein YifL
MKNKFYSRTLIAALVALIAACGKPDPKEQLAKLKAEQAALAKKIADLEKTVTPDSVKVRLKEIAVAEVKPQKLKLSTIFWSVQNLLVFLRKYW